MKQNKLRLCFALLLNFSLLIILICEFVPFSPKMPAAGLDPSWAFALNQALAQGLVFGRDIIFTLGPYSSIYTKAYHPATDFMMISGSLYLAFAYWLAMFLLMKTLPKFWILAFSIVFLGMIYSRDALFFSYPLLVGLTCLKKEEQHSCFIYLILFASFGLLALVKGSFFIICLITTLLCFIYLFSQKRRRQAITLLASFIGSMLSFWLAAGQKIHYLPSFLLQTISLSASFSEAMAIDGQAMELYFYLINAVLILLALSWQKHIPPKARLFLLSLFFVFLFISFKAGFARHFGHAFIPGTSILLAALFLIFINKAKMVLPIIAISVCSWSFINSNYTSISLINNFKATYLPALNGFKNRIKDTNWAKQNFDLSLLVLREQSDFPRLKGKSDIYSYDQSFLISSGNRWSPRPIFQSYSVFNQSLANKNRRYLLSKNSPNNLIFRLAPIDNRLPSLEDGASWPLIMANYQLNGRLINNFLLLKKKKNLAKSSASLKSIQIEKHSLGEAVLLPEFNQPIFAEIEIKPNFWGTLLSFLYKPSQLQINFLLKDGRQINYRLIASMTKSGFLISPLIETTEEFALLYDKQNALDAKRVKSFTILAQPEKIRQWSKDYSIHFKKASTS